MDPISIAGFLDAAVGYLFYIQDLLKQENYTRSQDIIANFTDLQAEKVLQIQSEIARIRHQRSPEGLIEQDLSDALHRYAKALRDYETLSQETLLKNPFKPRWPRSCVPGHHLQAYPEISEESGLRELSKRGRLLREKRHDFLERLVLGSFGGIMLIGPMLLMVLHTNRNTTLITTSVATMLFAVVLALYGRSMAGKDVLAAVAAYAAVLVVFVGTSVAPVSSA